MAIRTKRLVYLTSTLRNCQGSLSSMSSGNRPGRFGERRPVGVDADDRAEIGRLHLEAAAEVHLVGLDDAGVRVLERPDHAGQNRRGHLHAGRVLIGRERPRLLDRELRAVPVGVAGVAVEEHAEFVDSVDDLGSLPGCAGRSGSRRRGRRARAATAPRRRTGDRRSGRSGGRPPRPCRRAPCNSRRSRSNSLWVTRKPNWPRAVGVQERTRVLAPGWLRKIAAPQPLLWKPALAGAHFSCVPQPSSAGCMPSDRKPSIDQVLTNTLRGFGVLARWVSRSAICTPLTPRRWASLPQSARVFGSALLSPRSAARLSERLLDEPGHHARIGAAAGDGGRSARSSCAAPPSPSRAGRSWCAPRCRATCRNRSPARARRRCRYRARRSRGNSA